MDNFIAAGEVDRRRKPGRAETPMGRQARDMDLFVDTEPVVGSSAKLRPPLRDSDRPGTAAVVTLDSSQHLSADLPGYPLAP